MQKMDLEFEEDKIKAAVGLPLRDICDNLAGDQGIDLFNNYLEYQDKIHDIYLREFKNTSAILNSLLKSGFRLGVVTSKRRESALRGLKLTGIYNFIEILIALEDSPRSKPEAEPVTTALIKMQVQPENALYVGDSPFDIQCGKMAGVYTAGVTWGISAKNKIEKEKPDIIIDEWQQLLSWLK